MLRPDEQMEIDVDLERDKFNEWLEDRHMTFEQYLAMVPFYKAPEQKEVEK